MLKSWREFHNEEVWQGNIEKKIGLKCFFSGHGEIKRSDFMLEYFFENEETFKRLKRVFFNFGEFLRKFSEKNISFQKKN